MKAKISKNIHGVTLVETMAAILVFGLVAVGMLDVCAQSMVMGKRAELSYTANNLAKNHLETLKSIPFSSLTSAAETDTRVDSLGVPDEDGVFKRNTTVTTSYSSDANLVRLTVTVDYQVKKVFSGNPVSISTVVFQYA